MFEMFGASFGATLAGCLTLVGTAGVAVFFFMKRKHDAERRTTAFQQMQTIFFEEIKSVKELVTIRKPVYGTVPFADDKKVPFLNLHVPGSSREIFMTYSGMITCGYDLSKIRFVREGLTNHVKIILPASRILDAYVDVSTLKVHYQSEGIFADNFKLEHQRELLEADLENQKRKAVQGGILAQADAEIRQRLTNMISEHGWNENFDVEILNSENESRQNLLR
ncbi:MAG: DUF4230 domain-containing protein [Selenomonadaceae bacterium]|nr:DUF4230 domain-containing protein [Selenomonadaceae bacterium]